MGLLGKLAGHKGKAEDNEIKSITDNLNHVLNTTRDYGSFLHNFGISDYKYLSTREDIAKAIINEVTENIELFEPRVALEQIVNIKDDKLFRLSFRIDCVVRNTGQSLKLFLDPVHDRYQISP
jgi:predicted component of type VI protein secretion system